MSKDIEEARKGTKVITAIQPGLDYAGPGQATTTSMESKFSVRVDTNFRYPDHAVARISALSQIITAVLSHFPNMTMDDVLKAMKGALEKRIWDDMGMGSRLKDYYMSQMGLQVLNPYQSMRYEARITDYDQRKKESELAAKRSAINARQHRELTELEKLKKKYSYMDDIEELTLDDLRQIDNYTNELKGDVKL